jgi:putative SOS response-associated peptidase YedK
MAEIPLVAADGFYEWRKTAKPKLPLAIAMKDGRPSPLLEFGKTRKIQNLKNSPYFFLTTRPGEQRITLNPVSPTE